MHVNVTRTTEKILLKLQILEMMLMFEPKYMFQSLIQ